jgi:hypothetical protein
MLAIRHWEQIAIVTSMFGGTLATRAIRNLPSECSRIPIILTAQEQDAKKHGMTETNICRDIMNVRYRNARGRQFEMEFALWMRAFIRFEAEPHGSLVSRQVRETPAV